MLSFFFFLERLVKLIEIVSNCLNLVLNIYHCHFRIELRTVLNIWNGVRTLDWSSIMSPTTIRVSTNVAPLITSTDRSVWPSRILSRFKWSVSKLFKVHQIPLNVKTFYNILYIFAKFQ